VPRELREGRSRNDPNPIRSIPSILDDINPIVYLVYRKIFVVWAGRDLSVPDFSDRSPPQKVPSVDTDETEEKISV
jgi:hypothetical protein